MKHTTTTLVLTEALPAAGMALLRQRSDVRLRVLAAPTQEDLAAALPGADGLILVMERPVLTEEMISVAKELRVACRFGAGYDNFDVAALTRRGIPLATTAGANADTVAEHALYLMLALAKRGPALDRAVKAGGWPRGLGNIELRDRTCAIVGYGRIGRAIAKRLAGFDMNLVIVDPQLPHSARLEDALPRADFVVLACALNAQTKDLVNETTIKKMKRGAFVVNVARGPIVEERALVRALEEGRLAGAGLDVLESEPPASGHPLLARDAVVLSPHVAGHVASAHERMAIACAQNALAGLDGRLNPDSVVNREVLFRPPPGA